MTLNVADEISYEFKDNLVKFSIEGLSTNWMGFDDAFITRIGQSNLNRAFPKKHLKKEIEMKNVLDEGIRYLKSQKYIKAIGKFDKVLFYDSDYGDALLNKSYSLRCQKHFVKSLRYYRRSVNAEPNLRDNEYYMSLLKEANGERDAFPKLKRDIYAGDEYFAKGEFAKAIERYDSALANPSKFKDKILSKLLNKKATALLKLNEFGGALDCFRKSREVGVTDYAIFGEGICEHNLGLDVTSQFKNQLDITKRQMLKQLSTLNDLEFFSESLEISNYLYGNHFKVDEFYLRLLDARKFALENLDMDLSEIDWVIGIVGDNL